MSKNVRHFPDGSVILRLTAEQARAVQTAITLCVALAPRDVAIPEARAMGEVTAMIGPPQEVLRG